jgi:hypothetical protein
MNTPSLNAPVGGGGSRQVCPEGVHVARCYQIIDLGTSEQGGNFPGKKRKVQFLFETPYELAVFNEDAGEQPFYVRSMYTLSMNEKAILRKDVQSWIGKTMDDKQAAQFNIFSLIGKPCMVNIVHEHKGENTYANIKAIMPLAKGQACPEPINEALCFTASMPDMDVFAKLPTFIQDKIKESDEFQNYMAQGMESMPPAQPQRTSLPADAKPANSYNPTQAGTAKAYTSDAFFDNIDGNEPPF